MSAGASRFRASVGWRSASRRLPCCVRASVGLRSASGRGSALFSSPTGYKIRVLYNRGPSPNYKPYGYKTGILYKTGLCVSWSGCRGVGFPRRLRWSSLRRRFSAFVRPSGLLGVWLSVWWLPQLLPPGCRLCLQKRLSRPSVQVCQVQPSGTNSLQRFERRQAPKSGGNATSRHSSPVSAPAPPLWLGQSGANRPCSRQRPQGSTTRGTRSIAAVPLLQIVSADPLPASRATYT